MYQKGLKARHLALPVTSKGNVPNEQLQWGSCISTRWTERA